MKSDNNGGNSLRSKKYASVIAICKTNVNTR